MLFPLPRNEMTAAPPSTGERLQWRFADGRVSRNQSEQSMSRPKTLFQLMRQLQSANNISLPASWGSAEAFKRLAKWNAPTFNGSAKRPFMVSSSPGAVTETPDGARHLVALPPRARGHIPDSS